MNRLISTIGAACVFLLACMGPGTARAQHVDVLTLQADGRLVTGTADFDHNQWTLGGLVFSNEFGDLNGNFAVNNPGFNALAADAPDLPTGSQALPGETALAWDFWPMRIDDVTSNLFYWNGHTGTAPSDVRFGPPPSPDYRLSLFDKSGVGHAVDGTDLAIPGGVIANTAADGFLHQHRYFGLDDGDANPATDPADGIYLVAMRMQMAGLESSLPLFVVFGTPESSVAALDSAAVPWVIANVDTLVLLGDYNKDGAVGAADYTVWRNTVGDVGFALPADGDASGDVRLPDYEVWKDHYGLSSPTTGAGAAAGGTSAGDVPEPSSIWVATLALAAVACLSGRARSNRIGSR